MKGIKGKTAIVTGGARGIGKGIAKRLASEGARLIIADIDGEAAEAAAKEFSATGADAGAYRADLRKVSEIDAMIEYAHNTYGSIDILVNNAGVQIREWATEFEEEKFDLLMDLNLTRCKGRSSA
jgi:NAD(P)-dependent dehydrogenase (short-subunit alcohol dehydrogenase family)